MDKKRLKNEYRETPRQMGVFLIRNIANDKVFLGAGLDLVGTMNRHKFQLTNGSHPNARLQRDWNEVGSNNFAFEIIDQITPQDDPAFDSKAELEFMEKLWLQEAIRRTKQRASLSSLQVLRNAGRYRRARMVAARVVKQVDTRDLKSLG